MITAARLLARITSWGLTLAERHGKLVVSGRRPRPKVRQLIGVHREALLSALRGQDVPLTTGKTRAHLQSLGLVQLETGEWTHPLGDEIAEQILLNEIDFEDARAEAGARAEARTREAYALGQPPAVPPLVDIELRPSNVPGRSTFTIECGRRYRPLPIETEME